MDLEHYEPLRKGKYPKFVSVENGCKHIGHNPTGDDIRQFRVDGGIFTTPEEGERCDYLLLNDTSTPPRAYYIELKGSNIKKAISQIDTTVQKLSSSLPEYDIYRRIVYHTGSHDVNHSYVLRWKAQYSGRAIIKSSVLEENIS